MLAPDNALNRDLRDLAGSLDFSIEDIRYICGKKDPFRYMLDQWCKREGDNATMGRLHAAIIDLKRPDAVEVIENGVRGAVIKFFSDVRTLLRS